MHVISDLAYPTWATVRVHLLPLKRRPTGAPVTLHVPVPPGSSRRVWRRSLASLLQLEEGCCPTTCMVWLTAEYREPGSEPGSESGPGSGSGSGPGCKAGPRNLPEDRRSVDPGSCHLDPDPGCPQWITRIRLLWPRRGCWALGLVGSLGLSGGPAWAAATRRSAQSAVS